MSTVNSELAVVQEVPLTASEAAASFRCDVYTCTLSGRACAGRWRQAHAADFDRTKGRCMPVAPCRGCLAGKARAYLLKVEEPDPYKFVPFAAVRARQTGPFKPTTRPEPEPQEEPRTEMKTEKTTTAPAPCKRCGAPRARLRLDAADPMAAFCSNCRARARKAHEKSGVDEIAWLLKVDVGPVKRTRPNKLLDVASSPQALPSVLACAHGQSTPPYDADDQPPMSPELQAWWDWAEHGSGDKERPELPIEALADWLRNGGQLAELQARALLDEANPVVAMEAAEARVLLDEAREAAEALRYQAELAGRQASEARAGVRAVVSRSNELADVVMRETDRLRAIRARDVKVMDELFGEIERLGGELARARAEQRIAGFDVSSTAAPEVLTAALRAPEVLTAALRGLRGLEGTDYVPSNLQKGA